MTKKEDLHEELFLLFCNSLKAELEKGNTQASMLNVARQFLKDQGVSCSDSSKIPDLQDLENMLPDLDAAAREFQMN